MSTSKNGLVQITSNVSRLDTDDEPTPGVGLNRRNMLKALAATAALPLLADACAVPDSAPSDVHRHCRQQRAAAKSYPARVPVVRPATRC